MIPCVDDSIRVNRSDLNPMNPVASIPINATKMMTKLSLALSRNLIVVYTKSTNFIFAVVIL